MKRKLLSLIVVLGMVLPNTACTVDQALSDIDLVLQTSQVVCSAIGVVAPADSAACALISGVAISGLNIIKTDYDAWKASGATTDMQKLEAAITTLQANLPQELAAAHIVDPHAVSTVTAWVGLVTSSLNDVLSLLPQLNPTPPTPTTRAKAVAAVMPTPESLAARWNNEVCKGDAACTKLVKVHHVHSHFAHVASLGLLK
jgi:hypothetical protein